MKTASTTTASETTTSTTTTAAVVVPTCSSFIIKFTGGEFTGKYAFDTEPSDTTDQKVQAGTQQQATVYEDTYSGNFIAEKYTGVLIEWAVSVAGDPTFVIPSNIISLPDLRTFVQCNALRTDLSSGDRGSLACGLYAFPGTDFVPQIPQFCPDNGGQSLYLAAGLRSTDCTVVTLFAECGDNIPDPT